MTRQRLVGLASVFAVAALMSQPAPVSAQATSTPDKKPAAKPAAPAQNPDAKTTPKRIADRGTPGQGATKVQTLRGADYLRVWIVRGPTSYLIHLNNVG